MKHVTVLSGVSSIIDCLAFSLCEAGEGVLLGRPTYVGFISDLVSRAGVKPVLVDFERRSKAVHPMSLEAVECYEDALIQSVQNGTPVRALLLCHPHNPFGLCYDSRVLEAYLDLCSKHRIHFIRYVHDKLQGKMCSGLLATKCTRILSSPAQTFPHPQRSHLSSL